MKPFSIFGHAPRGPLLLCVFTLGVAFAAHAQDRAAPPTGPAQIFERSAERREKEDLKRADKASEAAAAQAEPKPGSAPGPSAPGAAPHDHTHAMLNAPSMPTAEPTSTLEKGTIEVEVLRPGGEPYSGAQIVLGVMQSAGARSEERAKANPEGRYTFKGLATGSQQAYRVNVLYGGAKFSSTPFRLPDDTGYRVRIPLKPTTRSDQVFFQLIGQTVVELRDDRLHVTQQARLANAGKDVYVLPQDGIVIPLPDGYTAFSWQNQMTDQRGEEVSGKGFRLRGSFPPGTVTLAWSYDLKREGDSARIPVNLPWKTYTYRVISEAPEGLKLRVNDFSPPERMKDEGRSLWFTQIQKTPGDPLLGAFTIKLDGIPGPGPGRFIAVALAVVLVAFGLSRAFRRVDDSGDRKLFIEQRKAELLAEARAADEEHARGESGPEYLARRLGEIETELGLLLRDEESLKAPRKASA